MLTLVVLLVVAGAVVREGGTINLTYIVKKEGDQLTQTCVAEELERYAAIGWAYPLPVGGGPLPNTTSKFLPTITNDYNCKFQKRDNCVPRWTIINWKIDDSSSKTNDLITDERWEDFPTIFTSNSSKTDERIEVPNNFKIGLSIRTGDTIQLLICEGWKVEEYPCYHLEIGKLRILLRKYLSGVPEDTSLDKTLDSYRVFSNILSGDEWRNFLVSVHNSTISITDISTNRTVIEYEDKEPIRPLYLVPRSIGPALWKFHQNHFLYTATTQISRLGPTLKLTSMEICVALYVSTCPYCTMTFFIINNNVRKVLKEIPPTNFQWINIKLKSDYILPSHVTLFVETKLKGTNETGFWAVDDVRVCHENEVKVTSLSTLKDQDTNASVSCEVVRHPKWRPKKLVYDQIKDFPTINYTTTSTSISLTWTQEDPTHQISYFISYEANDICDSPPFNVYRSKSSGFLITKLNQITIDKLVAYTKYNITFSSMLHAQEKKLFITTQELDTPTLEEEAIGIQIDVNQYGADISWTNVMCQSIYGHLVYGLALTDGINKTTIQLKPQTETSVEIKDLQPFSFYSLTISTARSFQSLQNATLTRTINVSFTTKESMARPPLNLEAYAIDKSSVSLRYDLPESPNGVPVSVQVTRCNSLNLYKCKTATFVVARCALFPTKYCIDINNLISLHKHTLKVSLKNANTQFFGEQAEIQIYTDEKIPAPPANIAWVTVPIHENASSCHLNLSWTHPYHPNGTITSFKLRLSSPHNKDIIEEVHIVNKTYHQRYEHQIQYLPYGTTYDLVLKSANDKYDSVPIAAKPRTIDIGDHINQNPELVLKTGHSAIFKVPSLDNRLDSAIYLVIVQDFNHNKSVPDNIQKNKKVWDHLCHNYGSTYIAFEVPGKDTPQEITVGTQELPLKPLQQYCITFIVTNQYNKLEHDVVYYKKFQTLEESVSSAATNYRPLYALLLLLLLIPLGFFLYRCYRKKGRSRITQSTPKENEYESLPFEECVTNETYDQLLHK